MIVRASLECPISSNISSASLPENAMHYVREVQLQWWYQERIVKGIMDSFRGHPKNVSDLAQ
jgi:hypothetical protein